MSIQTPTDIIADACQGIYHLRAPQVGTAEHIIEVLGARGFEIGPKPDAFSERWETGIRNIVNILHGPCHSFDIPDIVEEVRALKAASRHAAPVTLTLPDGERVSGPDVVELAAHLSAGAEADDDRRDGMRCGTVAMLTPEGERLVQAAAAGDFTRMSMGAWASLHELRERLVVPDIGSLVAGYAERPLRPGELRELLSLEPGKADEIHAGHTRGWDAAPAVTRDLVLFNSEDYEGNAAAADALGLDSYPLEAPVTLGWLVDEHAAYRQTVETLFWELTNGCVSKPNTDLDVVRELAAKANVVNLLEEHPALAQDPLFRPVMDGCLDPSEIAGQVEIARRRLDGHRVVRVGTLGTWDLGKVAADV